MSVLNCRLSDYYLVSSQIKKSNINSQDNNGNTLLHLIYGHYNELRQSDYQILERLLNSGYSIVIKC